MPELTARTLAARSNVRLPKRARSMERYWYTSKGGVIAGRLVYERYGRVGGDPEYRKKRWREWWSAQEILGRNQNLGTFAIQKPIRRARPSVRFAEAIGIILGDGAITARQVTVSLNSETDREYALFVLKLFSTIFGVTPSLRKGKKSRVVNITISRTALVTFLRDRGLDAGDKIRRQIDMPEWIKNRPAFARACVRGLMDTDGCIFLETHLIRGKKYSYPRISFVSMSKPLRATVCRILEADGFSPKERTSRAITLERRSDVVRYFRRIGTSNPKHADRFKHFIGRVG
jgi:hypothetical protein